MTAALRLVANQPLDVGPLGEMLADAEDLKLVWPDAIVPFDAEQWRTRLSDHPEHVSFWVEATGERVGHVALLATEEMGVWAASYIYLAPSVRGRGLAADLMTAIEGEARNRGGSAMRLRVRSYNPRAIAVYTRAGYAPAARDGTLIIMRKPIASN